MNYELKEQDLAQIENFKNNKDGWLKRIDNCISKLKAEKDPKNEPEEENDPACERFKKKNKRASVKIGLRRIFKFSI